MYYGAASSFSSFRPEARAPSTSCERRTLLYRNVQRTRTTLPDREARKSRVASRNLELGTRNLELEDTRTTWQVAQGTVRRAPSSLAEANSEVATLAVPNQSSSDLLDLENLSNRLDSGACRRNGSSLTLQISRTSDNAYSDLTYLVVSSCSASRQTECTVMLQCRYVRRSADLDHSFNLLGIASRSML